MEQNEGQQPAVVLKDTEIRGDVSLRGWLRLFGSVSGNVRSGGRVEVMAGAVVEGTVECRELYVEGEIGGDARAEVIQRLDLDRPQPFFTPVQGENLQRHRFTVSQSDVLSLSGPFQVEAELRLEGGLPGAETAQRLSDPALARWTFHSGGAEVPFSRVRAEGDAVVLEYDGTEALEADGAGIFSISCWGQLGAGALVLDGVGLRSRPAGRVAVDSAANGDIPLDLEAGGYCFGRRPAAYGLCYFRSDQVFRKRGSRVNLHLDIAPVVTDLTEEGPRYQFNQYIIDKRDAVAIVPDDVYVDQVAWEYFNGLGWRPLTVSGNRNPFSCKNEGELEVVFDVPGDLSPAEVNAQMGYYIRARVVHVANEFSMTPRWKTARPRSAPAGPPPQCSAGPR